jgi:hypothetical protein
MVSILLELQILTTPQPALGMFPRDQLVFFGRRWLRLGFEKSPFFSSFLKAAAPPSSGSPPPSALEIRAH